MVSVVEYYSTNPTEMFFCVLYFLIFFFFETMARNSSKVTSLIIGEGGPTPFLPIPNPDFDVSLVKMGKKVYGKRGKSIRFNTLSAYYYHCFLHIKLDISCYILHDSVMTVSS